VRFKECLRVKRDCLTLTDWGGGLRQRLNSENHVVFDVEVSGCNAISLGKGKKRSDKTVYLLTGEKKLGQARNRSDHRAADTRGTRGLANLHRAPPPFLRLTREAELKGF